MTDDHKGDTEADYDEAIQLWPDYAEAFNNRGNAYSAKGDYDRAIRDYDQAIRLNPDNALAISMRERALQMQSQ